MKQSSEPKIIVNGLVKSFGNLEVLKGINAEIDKGEVICVIGPSGSGKSTFLRCLNLLEEPTAGEIVVDGLCITDKKRTSIRSDAISVWYFSSSIFFRTDRFSRISCWLRFR